MSNVMKTTCGSSFLPQLMRVLVLTCLLASSVLTLFGTAYVANARSMGAQAVKSIALYLPLGTRSARLEVVLRTSTGENVCLKGPNVKPQDWSTTYTFHVSLASGAVNS